MSNLALVNLDNPAMRVPTEATAAPLEKPRGFLETHRMAGRIGPRAFADFEAELHARLMDFEREVIASEMKAIGVDVPA